MEELVEISYPHADPHYFRLVKKGEPEIEHLCHALDGLAKHDSTDNTRGRILVETEVTFCGQPEKVVGNKYYWELAVLDLPATGQFPLQPPPEGAELVVPAFGRLCFNRAEGTWRHHDEINNTPTFYAKSLQGIMRIHWFDETNHLYHAGEQYRLGDTIYYYPLPMYKKPTYPNAIIERVRKRALWASFEELVLHV